jgi:hypothetical protein
MHRSRGIELVSFFNPDHVERPAKIIDETALAEGEYLSRKPRIVLLGENLGP